MYAVLYTNQLEPITVVDIPLWLWDRLAQGQTIKLPVLELPSFVPTDQPLTHSSPKVVEIFGERIKHREHTTLMIFTVDEESALLLRAEFLPGQRGELRNRTRAAFAAGFLRAFQEFRA